MLHEMLQYLLDPPPREMMFSQICKSEVLEMTPCSIQLINQSMQIGTA